MKLANRTESEHYNDVTVFHSLLDEVQKKNLLTEYSSETFWALQTVLSENFDAMTLDIKNNIYTDLVEVLSSLNKEDSHLSIDIVVEKIFDTIPLEEEVS